jgi:hypothetical protein
MESLELRVWTVATRGRRTRPGDPRQLRAELRGTYDCYTETGVERVWIEERADGWDSEPTTEAVMLTHARNGDEDAAELLASDLLHWALEAWTPADA